MTSEPNPDKHAIADNIRHTVERTALRKVRKLVDELDSEEIARHRLEKRALIIAVVAATVATVWFVSGLIASDEKFERGRSIQLPERVAVPQRD